MAPIKVLASQAQSINLYRNIRTKVMKCCANIYFNWQCQIKNVLLAGINYYIIAIHNGMAPIKGH